MYRQKRLLYKLSLLYYVAAAGILCWGGAERQSSSLTSSNSSFLSCSFISGLSTFSPFWNLRSSCSPLHLKEVKILLFFTHCQKIFEGNSYSHEPRVLAVGRHQESFAGRDPLGKEEQKRISFKEP